MFENFQNSLENSFGSLGPFLLNLLAAIAVLVIGYIVAKLIAGLTQKALGKTTLDERIARSLSRDGGEPVNTERIISKGVFWLVMLFVIIAVLQILNLSFVTEPLNRFLSTIFAFIPKLIAAAILGFVAYVVASLLRFLTRQALHAARVDERFQSQVVEERAAQRPQAATTARRVSVADSLSSVVYYLVWLFFLPAILDTLDLGGILRPVERMVDTILAALPNIIAAILILLLAYVVGKVVAGLISNVLRSIGFNRMMERMGLGSTEAGATPGRTTPADVAGKLVLVGIMIFAAMEAANLLGFEALNVLLAQLLVFLGQVILGLIILGVGLYLANLAYRAIRDSAGEKADLLAVVARIAIIVFAGALALRQMGIADSIINLAFGLLLGALAVAAAIAFGIGGRDFAKRQLERLEAASDAPSVLKPGPKQPGMERSPGKTMEPGQASTGQAETEPPPASTAGKPKEPPSGKPPSS